MKKLGFFNKILFVLNSIVAAMLLLSYLLPYVPPKTFSTLSILSLAVPILIILNIFFFIYWLFQLKKQLILSLMVLLIGYKYVGFLYKFSSSNEDHITNSLSIMTYNVRLFNLYEWIKKDGVEESIVQLIKKANPDILSLQEYHPHNNVHLDNYKYKFEKLEGTKTQYGQAIFSKFPIINSGSINFPNTANNAIFIDVVIDSDTLRIYNLHLQSLGINADVETFNKEESQRLFKRIGKTFGMQQDQVDLFLKHKATSPYKMIVSGDFNNTAYSYVYREIKSDLQDAFEVKGKGFGKTFDFKFFPTRIDFILVDKDYKVEHFITYKDKLSDHYPILSNISLN